MDKIKSVLYYYSTICLLIFLTGCKYHYTEFVTDLNKPDSISSIIQDSLIKFKCSIPKRLYGTVNLILNFKTGNVYNVDSLDVSIKLENGRQLNLMSHDKTVTDINGLMTPYFSFKKNNKTVMTIKTVNKNLTSINNYPINYSFNFTLGKSPNHNSIVVTIKAILSNNVDSIKYNHDFKLYAKQIDYYD